MASRQNSKKTIGVSSTTSIRPVNGGYAKENKKKMNFEDTSFKTPGSTANLIATILYRLNAAG